jgi:hypothetical protein
VAWAWPPIGRIGAMRPLGMAREWVRQGHEVHVLTGPGDRGGEYTPDLLDAGGQSGAIVHRADAPDIKRPTALRPAFEAEVPQIARARPVSRARQIAAQWKSFPDQQRSWIAPACLRVAELQATHPFDVVWSTSPPESAHYVGRSLAARGVPWVADFRDQWSEYLLARWDPVSRFFIDRITRRVLSDAAAITANADGVAASIRRASGRPVSCVRNGFDPPPLVEESVRPRTLGYFGRIDPLMQHPERLWPVFRALSSRGRPWTAELHLSPGGGGGAVVDVPEDLRPRVAILPPLKHPDALRKMQTFHALLLLAWETRHGDSTVAGKLYEYIGSGRPTLACAPASFEARRLVEETGTGLGAWSTAELVTAFEALDEFSVNPRGRAGLSRAGAAAALLEIFQGVTKLR